MYIIIPIDIFNQINPSGYGTNRFIFMNMTKQMVLGIDSGFGSSAFGICLLEFINGQIHVKLAEEYDQVRYEDAVSKIKSILKRMNQTSLNQEENLCGCFST